MTFPLRFIGDEHDPSHVIIELSGTVQWSAKGGWMEGITFRRPRMAADQTGAIIRLHGGGRIDMGVCVLDNEGSQGPVAIVTGEKSGGTWSSTEIKRSEASNGAIVQAGATLALQNVRNACCVASLIFTATSHVILYHISPFILVHHYEQSWRRRLLSRNRFIDSNEGLPDSRQSWYWPTSSGDCNGQLTKCRFVRNGDILVADKSSSCSPCTDNVAVVSSTIQTPLPGFCIEHENQSTADLKQY